MRPIEKTANFMIKVDHKQLAKRWKLDFIPLSTKFGKILRYWNANPDQRIGQVLINLGLLSDSLLIWNDEENDILKDQGLPPEEYLFWTSIYDKDERLLDEPITRLIKDLEVSHIKKILKMFYPKLSEDYKQAFDNVLQKYSPGITYDIESKTK